MGTGVGRESLSTLCMLNFEIQSAYLLGGRFISKSKILDIGIYRSFRAFSFANHNWYINKVGKQKKHSTMHFEFVMTVQMCNIRERSQSKILDYFCCLPEIKY